MKKLLSLILTISMLFSVVGTLPVMAEDGRETILNARNYTYLDIEYDRDLFVTFAELIDNAYWSNSIKVASTLDDDGNPLDPTEWYSYKGWSNAGTSAMNLGVLLVDSIEGVEGGKITEKARKAVKSGDTYVSSDAEGDDAFTLYTRTMLLNGISNYELDTSADNSDAKHYFYNAPNGRYKLGPIGGTGAHRTATGTYNAKMGNQKDWTLSISEKYNKDTEKLKSLSVLYNTGDLNSGRATSAFGTVMAGLKKIEISYVDAEGKASKETKYLILTNSNKSSDEFVAETDYSGDRLSKVIVYIPKYDENGNENVITTGNDISALAPKMLSEKNSEDVIGKAITLDDVVFNNDAQYIKGKSVPFADIVIGRKAQATDSGRRYNVDGYIDSIEIPFDADKTVTSVKFVDSVFTAQKEPVDEEGNSTYLEDLNPAYTAGNGCGYHEVTIPGASDQYRYFAKFARVCSPSSALIAMTFNDYTHAEKIAVINEKIDTAETIAELEAAEDEIAEYVAENPEVLESDFNISVIADKKAEIARLETLNEKKSTRVDIIATAKTPATGYSVHKIDMFKNAETFGSKDTVGSVYYEGANNQALRPVMNTYYLGYKVPSYFTDASKFNTVWTWDITNKGYDVVEEGTATGTRAVKGEDGAWTRGSEEVYQTKYYKVPADNGSYILGPVAVEDEDASTDVFLSLNTIFLGRRIKDDGTGTSNESLNENVFENINLSGDYLNVLVMTDMHEGDATLIPIKVTYTTGEPETHYALVSKISYTDRRLGDMVYCLPKKADGTEYTQAEVVAATKEKLTASVAKTIGVDKDATIRDITFVDKSESANIIIPTKRAIGTWYNRNTSGTDSSNSRYAEDITVPLDSTRTISSVTITNWQAATTIDGIVAPHNGDNGNTDYRKIKINGYDGDYDFFVYFGRTCQGRSALFGMSVTQLSANDKIEKINEQLEKAVTEDEVKAALLAKATLIRNSTVLEKDFSAAAVASAEAKLEGFVMAEIEAAANLEDVNAVDAKIDGYASAYGIDVTGLKEAVAAKIADFGRVDALDDRDEYYFPIEYNLDAFATYQEILEFGVFETKVNGAYMFPEKDLAGNVLSADGNWLSTKGFVSGAPGTITRRPNFFLIEAIDGIEDTRIGGSAYTSYTNDAVKTVYKYTSSMTINGNDKMILESQDEDGTRHYKLDAGNVNYKLGPIGGTGVHRAADGGYNVKKLGESEKYKFERTQENAEKLSVLFAYPSANDGNTNQASFEKVVINYNDGKPAEEKYILLTTIADNQALHDGGHHDSDRLGKSIVAVPKVKDGVALDHTNGSVLNSNFTYLTMTNDTTIAGIDVTLDDVIFPGDVEVVTGEAVPVADLVIGSNAAVTNGGRFGPGGYVNHFTFDFGKDVDSIVYTPNLSYGKLYPGAIVTGQMAFIPVTIPGASEDYVYYAKIGRVCNYTVSLMAATSYAESLLSKIEKAEDELAKITENSSMEDVAYAEKLLSDLLADGKIKESDFDAEVLATFKEKALAVKEKANISGAIEMTYVAGTKPVANVTIKNLSGLAGKKYKVIIACYDENNNLLGKTVKDCLSTTEKVSTFTVEANSLPEGTEKVKGFIWKDFASLLPLATSDEAVPSAYALDRFFNAATGEYIYDESGELNVVFIGDSLTQGASTYDGDSLSSSEKMHWTNVICEYFADKTGKKVNLYNGGVGGVQTSFVAKMISQTAEDKNADIVFIENVNDLNTSATNAQKWTENLVRGLAKLDKKPVVILAHAVNPFCERDVDGDKVKNIEEGKKWQLQHINAKDAVANAYNLASVDYVSYYYENTNGFDTDSDWMQNDYGPSKIADKNVHPLTEGYNRFGKYIVSQIDADPSAYITRIKPAEDVAVINADVADNEYTLTYPTSPRFTYKGFNVYTKTNKLTGYTYKDTEFLVDWKYDFPHGGAAQAVVATEGAEFEFTTEASHIEIVHSSPYLANTRADFDIYVDGELYLENTTSNPYANVLNTTSVEISGEGVHKVKVVVKPDSVKKVFNFAYLVEQK